MRMRISISSTSRATTPFVKHRRYGSNRVGSKAVVLDGTFNYGTAFGGTKIEEINKYFSGRVFAAGIVQRKEWLLASPEERKAWMELNDGDIIACHPSNYK